MSNIHHTARVPAPSTRQLILPPMARGIHEPNGNIDARSGYAWYLDECSYPDGRLVIGRPGLEYFWSGDVLPDAIIKWIDDTDISTDARGNSDPFSITNDFSGHEATASKVYTRGTPTNPAVTTRTSVFDKATESSGNIQDICYFAGSLIILCKEQLYRYKGGKTFYCGSISSNVTNAVNSSTNFYSGTTYTSTSLGAPRTYYCKVNTTSIMLKKTGDIAGTVTASITYDGTTYSSDAVTVDTGISTEWALVDFVFSDLPEVIPGVGGFTVVLTASAGDTSNYISVAKDFDNYTIMNVNGDESPTGTQLAVFNGRLYIGGDLTTYKVWFSNYNDPDDYYTTSSDGMITYGGYLAVDNSTGAQSFGVFTFFNTIAICGYNDGQYYAEFYDKNHSRLNRLTGARLGGNYSIATKYGIFFISVDGRVGQITNVSADRDVDVEWLSDPIRKYLSFANLKNAGLISFNEDLAQIYVTYTGSFRINVLHLPGKQWTRYNLNSFDPDITILASFISGDRVGTTTGATFKLSDKFSATDELPYSTYTATPPTASIVPHLSTHKCRFSRFHRTRLKQYLWDIENDGFSATTARVYSEAGVQLDSHSITGDPPKAIRVHVKDNGFRFDLTGITVDEYTEVGEIALDVSTDGRSN